MKTKRPPLRERVREAVAAIKPRPSNWIERLPPGTREEILAIKAAWRAGNIDSSARRLAESISKECLAEGIKTCSPEHMRSWLAKD
jgi:hypothetical protein